ncbi:MAG: septal ring lytic transglycosylase RlpA family protein [Alphaproteobacteria bacterium]
MKLRTFSLLASFTFFAACESLPVPDGFSLPAGFGTGESSDGPLVGVELVNSFLANPKPLSTYQTGDAYEVNGIRYEPAEDFAYSANGLVAVFADSVDGALTASGETYRSNELTAAHPTLPFQTVVNVRRIDNDKSVAVRINDRGPFAFARIIELSKAAADVLDVTNESLVEVQVTVLMPETELLRSALANNRVIPGSVEPNNLETASAESTSQTASTGGYYVQVGVYRELINANGIRDRMASIGDTKIERQGELYRVVIGPYSSNMDAQAVVGQVFAEGAINAIVIQR